MTDRSDIGGAVDWSFAADVGAKLSRPGPATTDYTRALSSGIQSLNTLLSELGGKQILIHQVKKKGWFSRD